MAWNTPLSDLFKYSNARFRALRRVTIGPRNFNLRTRLAWDRKDRREALAVRRGRAQMILRAPGAGENERIIARLTARGIRQGRVRVAASPAGNLRNQPRRVLGTRRPARAETPVTGATTSAT